jgi:hypothetical protein
LREARHAIVGTNAVDGPPQFSRVWYISESTSHIENVLLVVTPTKIISQDFN